MERIFVDSDIILDMLGNREPFYKHAAELFSLADKGEIQLFVSSLSFAKIQALDVERPIFSSVLLSNGFE